MSVGSRVKSSAWLTSLPWVVKPIVKVVVTPGNENGGNIVPYRSSGR